MKTKQEHFVEWHLDALEKMRASYEQQLDSLFRYCLEVPKQKSQKLAASDLAVAPERVRQIAKKHGVNVGL